MPFLRRVCPAHSDPSYRRACPPGEALLSRAPQANKIEALVAGGPTFGNARREVECKLKVVAGVQLFYRNDMGHPSCAWRAIFNRVIEAKSWLQAEGDFFPVELRLSIR